jgi:hypothetical protein
MNALRTIKHFLAKSLWPKGVSMDVHDKSLNRQNQLELA